MIKKDTKLLLVINEWKLPFFKKIFDENELFFIKHPGLITDTLSLEVTIDSNEIGKLAYLYNKANEKAAHSKMN